MKKVVFEASGSVWNKAFALVLALACMVPVSSRAQSSVFRLSITEFSPQSGQVEVSSDVSFDLFYPVIFVLDGQIVSTEISPQQIAAGQSICRTVPNVDPTGGDLWILQNTDLTDRTRIIGGLKWGSASGSSLLPLAVSAGKWGSAYLPTISAGKSYQATQRYAFDASSWVVGQPDFCRFQVPSLVNILDTSLKEGASGTTEFRFTVSRNDESEDFMVEFATEDITASAPFDYTATSGVINFTGSVRTVDVVIPVKGDLDIETDETFGVRLFNAPLSVVVQDDLGIGTIVNDDPTPAISVADIQVTEGDSGNMDAEFTLTLSSAIDDFVRADVRTVAVTATAGVDYVEYNQTVSFGRNETELKITVPIVGDLLAENDETFDLRISNPSNGIIADGVAVCTILDNEVGSRISIDDVSLTEGNAGTTDAVFTISMTGPNTIPVSVDYQAVSGTALVGSDFVATSGTATIPAGETMATIAVPVIGDASFEADETFLVLLSNPVNGLLTDAEGEGTILNDDRGEGFKALDTSVSEGNAAINTMEFRVILTKAHAQTVTVEYATADGTAVDGSDYSATSGTLTFPPGAVERVVPVTVTGDTVDEPNETVLLRLSNAMGALILDGEGVGTIVNDDAPVPPKPIVNALSADFGFAGEQVTVFGRNFSVVAEENLVRFGAVEAKVLAATATALTVEIPPGATYEPVSVTVGGLTGEGDRAFTVVFENNGALDPLTFGDRANLTSGSGASDIVAADFDGDGRSDIASLNRGNNTLSLFHNLSIARGISSGVFATRLDLPTRLAPADLVVADIDGDGLLDAVTIDSGSSGVSIFHNASVVGSLAFDNPATLLVGASPTSGDLADIDGDGLVDLLVALGDSGRIAVLRNTSVPGAVSFAAAQQFVVGVGPSKVLAADLDGDGGLDVVVVNAFNGVGGNSISVLRNTATRGSINSGSLSDPVTFPAAENAGELVNPTDLVAADFNRDGRVDLAILNRAGGKITAYRNKSEPETIDFEAADTFAAGLNPAALAVADFNGDALPDLAVSGPATGVVLLLQNLGSGPAEPLRFGAAVAVPTPGGPSAVFGADLDNNSKPELIVGGSAGTVSLFNNLLRSIPSLAWDDPGSIVYGDPLTEDHLDATANVPGSFVYDPPLGAHLEAGKARVLRATFVPTDITEHRIVQTEILIDVDPRPLFVTPQNAFKPFGAPLPAFAASYEDGEGGAGFVLGDTVADLDSPPVFFTEATAESPVGFYRIVSGGAFDSNYAITHLNPPDRTLKIGRAVPAISWPTPADIEYGTPLGTDQLNATADQPGLFEYDPPAGTVFDVGAAQTLRVAFTPYDNLNYEPVSVEVAINVLRARPTIIWNDPADITFGDALGATQLNAMSPVAGTFTYTPAAGTLLKAGMAHPLSVEFTPDDASRYLSAVATAYIDVLRANATITWATPEDIVYGTRLGGAQLNAVAERPGSLAYNPPAGTTLNAGNSQTLSVTFTPEDAANQNTVTKEVVINVLKATPTIIWNPPAGIIHGVPLTSVQLNAVASHPGSLSYDPPAGTYLDAGSAQTLSVTFTPDSPGNVESAQMQVTIDVAKADPVITWNDPAAIVYGTPLGMTQLNARADAEGSFVYTPPIATLLAAGADQPLTAEFTPADTDNYNSASRTVRIDVLKADPVIVWQPPASIEYGTPLVLGEHLNATATDIEGTFAYTPEPGTLLAVGTGRILSTTFTPDDADNYNAVTVNTAIDVRKAVPTITWDNPADMIHPATLSSVQLNATADAPGRFVYTPAAGAPLPLGSGHTLRVVFTPDDTDNRATATATVTVNVLPAVAEVTWPAPEAIGFGTPLGAAQLNAVADVPGSFTYSPPAGTVLAAGSGQELSVTFTPNDSNYRVITASALIDVAKADPTILWNTPADIAHGTPLNSQNHLNAVSAVPGTFDYSPPAGTILAAGAGQVLAVDFTPTDTANYNAGSKQVVINVRKAVPALTWNRPAGIVHGTPLTATQLNAAAVLPGTTDAVSGAFVYDPPLGTILDAGSLQALNVSFTPDDGDNFETASGSTVIDVAKAEPMIVWNNPAAIVYGAALGELQFNATADVPGVFRYQPEPGTVPQVGEDQLLSVVFIPESTQNYVSVSKTVSLDVLKANLIVRAENKTRGVGAPNPQLTASYIGLVNNDTSASLTQSATLTTAATMESPAGSYDIVVSGAASPNYNIQFRRGVLTVVPNQPPAVVVTAPLDGRRVAAMSDVRITADASDPDGSIMRVEFFADSTRLGEATEPPYSIVWSGVALGSYALTAVATDNLNESVVSAPVTLNVNPGINAATISESDQVTLAVTGQAGITYVIQVSNDLRHWTSINSFVATGGTQSFPDPDPASLHLYRFYRIIPLSALP